MWVVYIRALWICQREHQNAFRIIYDITRRNIHPLSIVAFDFLWVSAEKSRQAIYWVCVAFRFHIEIRLELCVICNVDFSILKWKSLSEFKLFCQDCFPGEIMASNRNRSLHRIKITRKILFTWIPRE